MKTTKSDLKIGSLKLVNGGMKGMVVSYLDPVMKNGNLFMDKCVVEKSAPVTFELMDKISQLGNYLLDICGYTTNELEREQLLSLLEITKLSAGSDNFQISGKLKVLGGNQVVSLTSPLIKESMEYEGYEEVMKLVDSIYADTKEYIGGKMMSAEELAVRFYKDKEGFDEDEFNKLPKDEQIRIGTGVLEKLGCIVINESEVSEVAEEGITAEVLKEDNGKKGKSVPKIELVAEEVVEPEEEQFNFSNDLEEEEGDVNFELE